MKKAQKITAALAISMGLTMGATPAANAIIRAPLAQANDQMSRSVVFIDKGTCTGTLIDKDWVLTAGHCLKGPGDSSGVTIGSPLEIGPDRGNFEKRTVARIATPYPVGGSAGKSADLALLKLNKSSSVLPAKVYEKEFGKPSEGTRTRSYGWSTTTVRKDSSGKYITPYAQKIPFQTGKLVDSRNVPAEDQMVGDYYAYPLAHAKLDGKARTVPGDSGGPLFLSDGRLYGVLRGSSKDIDKSAKNPWAKFDGSSYSGYTVIQDEIKWMESVTGVKFTDPNRNIELQKKSDANPKTFKTPTKSDYGTSEDEETLFLQVLYHSIMSDIDPNYPKPPIPKDMSVINRTPRDPRPYDSNLQAGDDKIPTTTSTTKKRPDWLTNPDYPTSEPSTSKKPEPEPSTTKNLLPDEPSTTKEKPTTTSKAEPKPSTPKDKPTTTSKAEPKPSTTKPTTTSKAEPKPSTPKDKPTTTSKAEPKPSTPKDKPTTTSKAEPKPSTPKDKPTTTSKAEPKPSTPKDKPTTTSKAEPKPSTPKDKPTTTSKAEPKPSTPKDKPTTTSKEEPKPSTPKEEPTTSKEEPKPVESSSPSESTEAPSLSETTDASEKPSSSSPSVSSPSPDEPSELTTSADVNSTAPDSDGDGTSTADSTSKNPSTSAKSTTSEDDEPVEDTTKPTTSKPDDKDKDEDNDKDDDTTSPSSHSQVGDFTDPKGVAVKGSTMNKDQLLKAINAGTGNRPGANSQKILDSLLTPLPASSQGSDAVAGPVVDTGGSVEKEGFFERIKNFLFG